MNISGTDFNVCEKVVLILDISDADFNVCENVVLILDISDTDFNVCEKVVVLILNTWTKFRLKFFKNNIRSFLEPLRVVDLVAAVRLLSKSNQVLHSKPLW